MEDSRKDVNEMYREMEEAVAKRVRETMELADARRRALAQSGPLPGQKQVRVDNGREIVELSNVVDENEDATRTNDATDTENRLRMEEIQQEFKDIDRSIEGEQSRVYGIAEVDDTAKDAESTAEQSKDVSRIGSDCSEAPVTTEKDINMYSMSHSPKNTAIDALNVIEDNSLQEIDHPSKLNPLTSPFNEDQELQATFDLPANDTRYQHADDKPEPESEFKLIHVLKAPTQDVTRDVENIPQECIETIVITQVIRPITNNPFDMMENNELADARLYGTNPFECSDDEVEIRLGEGATSVAPSWRNQTQNPFDSAENDTDTRQLGEEALNVARNFTVNPFDAIEEEIDADALSVAQTGAGHVEAAKRQLSENAEDLDNVFNSLIDSPEPMVEIGFDRLEQETRSDKDKNIAISHVPQ